MRWILKADGQATVRRGLTTTCMAQGGYDKRIRIEVPIVSVVFPILAPLSTTEPGRF